jgi:hypothetical protein
MTGPRRDEHYGNFFKIAGAAHTVPHRVAGAAPPLKALPGLTPLPTGGRGWGRGPGASLVALGSNRRTGRALSIPRGRRGGQDRVRDLSATLRDRGGFSVA